MDLFETLSDVINNGISINLTPDFPLQPIVGHFKVSN